MKSATETFESGMCRVVRVSKMQARGAGEKRRGFQEGWSLPLARPERSVPRSTVGRGRRREDCREDPQRETGRASSRKGKKKRDVERLSRCEKKKNNKVRKLGKMTQQLVDATDRPLLLSSLFWLVSKNIPERKRIGLPSQAFENISV